MKPFVLAFLTAIVLALICVGTATAGTPPEQAAERIASTIERLRHNRPTVSGDTVVIAERGGRPAVRFVIGRLRHDVVMSAGGILSLPGTRAEGGIDMEHLDRGAVGVLSVDEHGGWQLSHRIDLARIDVRQLEEVIASFLAHASAARERLEPALSIGN